MAHPYNFWNYERCSTEAQKYMKRSHFKNQSPSAYEAASKNGWIDAICSHMAITPIQKKVFWSNFDDCKKEASNYKNRSEFRSKCVIAYKIAKENNWLDLFYEAPTTAHHGWWNDKEKCREEALRYKSVSDFIKNAYGAYASCLKHGWLEELCTHMPRKWEKKWADKETCRKEALKFKTRTEFQNGNDGAYTYALRHGFLDEICSHMELKHVVKWNSKEACHNEALKYRTRTEFQEKSDSAYTYALRHGFLDDICGHMEVIGNMQRRCIYAFEFEDNHVYVGLTCNIRRREHSHLTEKKSAVYKHIASSGLSPQLIIVHDYTSKEAACILENETINIYRKNGWHILNRVKGGALGALPKKWTKDRCLSVLKECDSLSEFKSCFPGAYNSCLANEWMDEVYQIYPETYTEDEIRREAAKYQYREDFWRYSRDAYNSAFKQRLLGKICSELDLKWKERTEDSLEINRVISEIEFDELRDVAKKYHTKKSFKKGDRTAYNKACRLHILQAVCTHMTVAKKWTREECRTIAQKYTQRNDFRKNESRAYSAACEHGWLEEVCSHMPKPVPQKIWTKEECQTIALKYNHRSEFRKSDSRAYDISRRHGWLDEICSHMPLPDPAKVQTKISSESDHQKTWTKEECQAIALKYYHRNEFRKSDSRAYEISRRHGWLDEICSHMPLPELPMRWTKEECARIAKTYCRRSEFRKSNLKAYEAARTHNWLDEICSHMSGTKHKKRFYWTKERCQEKALLYQHRVDFKNGDGSAYSTAVRCGWLDEICSHMTKPSPKVRWTKEECHKVALKYKTASEFRKQERSVYATALQKGWLEDICSHLIFTSRKGLGRKYKK